MNPNGITYALIIAVENYNKPSLFKKVSYAAKDADDVKDALLSIGIDTENIKVLIDTDATHTAIITELKFLSNRVTKDDRIIFFFAGHGAFFDDTNWIIPVDAYKNSMKDTCIKISSILRYLKKSNTNRNIVFIDSCHSGFEPGEIIRGIDSAFMADELKYRYKDEEYCCGFASSKSNQKSISDPKLQNGVWTHYLVLLRNLLIN
ncbi:MAG: caspase family protein [Bacteroidales bacterium]